MYSPTEMITCTSCNKENPDDFKYCRYCGNPLLTSHKSARKSFWKKLPAWAWVLIIVGGIIVIVGLIIGSFVALSTVEGFASAVLLLLGAIGFGVSPLRKPENVPSLYRAVGLVFFALMGASIDQPGNGIYNKPIEMSFCESGTSLDRNENVSNPLPGTTYIQQDFTCYDDTGNPVKTINMFAVMGIRFVEYLLLGYLLLAIRKLLWNWKNRG
ncbi:MAG: zinc-ribbon domain-containing protein [Chitinophagales bacterium]